MLPAAFGNELPANRRLLTDTPAKRQYVEHYKGENVRNPIGRITGYSKDGERSTKALEQPMVRIKAVHEHEAEVVPLDKNNRDIGSESFTVNAAELSYFNEALAWARARLAEMYWYKPTRAQAVEPIKNWNYRFPSMRISHAELLQKRRQIANARWAVAHEKKHGPPHKFTPLSDGFAGPGVVVRAALENTGAGWRQSHRR